MERYYIKGGNKISGEHRVSGAKNAVLPLLAATVMADGDSCIQNCPSLSDVDTMVKLLRTLGCRVKKEGACISVNTSGIHSVELPTVMMGAMRSSLFLLGPLLFRCGEAVLGLPGGCAIGRRPIDVHLDSLRQMGAEIYERGDLLICRSNCLKGTALHLPVPSVGATENLMMAAAGAEGETRICNAAREPEIVDLQKFLQACGVKIKGAGSKEICVCGTTGSIHGAMHRAIADRIEGGTFLLAAAMTGGTIRLKDIDSLYMKAFLKKLTEAGCRIIAGPKEILLEAPERLRSVGCVKTKPYPGFPTDLQSPFLSAMARAEGTTCIEETIFENRFGTAEELRKMGAKIKIKGCKATVFGVQCFYGAHVFARDLRGGAALVLAGLAAEGETVVENICHIDRGYDKFEVALRRLGAKIERMRD